MPPSHTTGPFPGPTTASGDGTGTPPAAAGPSADPDPLAARVPTSAERTDIVLRVVDAAACDALDLDDAGRLISLAYRAPHHEDLSRIGRTLDVAEESIRAAARRRQQWWSLAGLAVCVLASVLMVLGVLHGSGPLDPY